MEMQYNDRFRLPAGRLDWDVTDPDSTVVGSRFGGDLVAALLFEFLEQLITLFRKTVAATERRTVRKDDLGPFDSRRAVPRWRSLDRDLVAWLHLVTGPAVESQRDDVGTFCHPLARSAILVNHVEKYSCMRIGEADLRHDSADRHGLRQPINRRGVVVCSSNARKNRCSDQSS